MRRDCYCLSCKNNVGFPLMGNCRHCEDYSHFEIGEGVTEKKFKKDARLFDLLIFLSVVTFSLLALFLATLQKVFG